MRSSSGCSDHHDGGGGRPCEGLLCRARRAVTVYLALASAPGPDSASSSKSHLGESDDGCETCHPADGLFGVRVDGRPSRARMKPPDRAAAPLRMRAPRASGMKPGWGWCTCPAYRGPRPSGDEATADPVKGKS